MTQAITAFTVIISLLAFYNRNTMTKMIFNPYMISEKNQWYRFITSGFIHADWMHLIFNMIAFYSFGMMVESYFDMLFEGNAKTYFILLYIGGMIAAHIPSFLKNKSNYLYNSLGASGAVSAVIFAAILLDPRMTIGLFFIPVPAIIFGPVYLAYCVYASRRMNDNINHDAHFWGAIYGIVFMLLFKPSLTVDFYEKLVHG